VPEIVLLLMFFCLLVSGTVQCHIPELRGIAVSGISAPKMSPQTGLWHWAALRWTLPKMFSCICCHKLYLSYKIEVARKEPIKTSERLKVKNKYHDLNQ